MKRNRNLVGVLAAALLAVVGGFLVYQSTSSSTSEAEEEVTIPLETVLVAKQDLPANQLVSAVSGDDVAVFIDTEQIPGDQVVAGAIQSLDDLRVLGNEGYVFSVTVPAGGQLSSSQVVKPGEEVGSALEPDPDKFAFTIALASERALGDQLRNGNRVAVIASFEGEGDSPRQTVTILENVRVIDKRNETLPTAEAQTANPLGTGLATTGRIYVTLEVDLEQAERLAYAAEYGSIWLTIQSEEATTDGSKILDRDVVLGLAEPEFDGPTTGLPIVVQPDDEGDDESTGDEGITDGTGTGSGLGSGPAAGDNSTGGADQEAGD